MTDNTRNVTQEQAEIRAMAIKWKEAGYPVVLLHGVDADGKCGCGKPECDSGNVGKHPVYSGWQNRAAGTIDQLKADLNNTRILNIGIAILAGSDTVVIDPDRHNPEQDGVANLAELERLHGTLPPTRTHQTGTGFHRFFRLPPGVEAGARTVAEAVDVKKAVSYLVAPPSVHRNGTRYRVVDDSEIALAPDWLVSLLQVGAACIAGWTCPVHGDRSLRDRRGGP